MGLDLSKINVSLWQTSRCGGCVRVIIQKETMANAKSISLSRRSVSFIHFRAAIWQTG